MRLNPLHRASQSQRKSYFPGQYFLYLINNFKTFNRHFDLLDSELSNKLKLCIFPQKMPSGLFGCLPLLCQPTGMNFKDPWKKALMLNLIAQLTFKEHLTSAYRSGPYQHLHSLVSEGQASIHKVCITACAFLITALF